MAKDTTNDQIADAIRQATEINLESSPAVSQAIAYQIVTQSVGLAMQNAVAQQQHNYMLRNAVVTAVARAVLELDPKEAIGLIDVAFNDDIDKVLEKLQKLMMRAEEMKPDDVKPPPSAAAKPSRRATKKRATKKRASKR